MDFLKVCPLTLVHVHGNNTLRLLDMRGNPSILEMTFAITTRTRWLSGHSFRILWPGETTRITGKLC